MDFKKNIFCFFLAIALAPASSHGNPTDYIDDLDDELNDLWVDQGESISELQRQLFESAKDVDLTDVPAEIATKTVLAWAQYVGHPGAEQIREGAVLAILRNFSREHNVLDAVNRTEAYLQKHFPTFEKGSDDYFQAVAEHWPQLQDPNSDERSAEIIFSARLFDKVCRSDWFQEKLEITRRQSVDELTTGFLELLTTGLAAAAGVATSHMLP